MECWQQELFSALDEPAETRDNQARLEKCGANCPYSHMPDEELLALRQGSRSEEHFLQQLCEQWRLRKEDDHYVVVFDRCYCPLVNNELSNAPKTLCYCSLGSLKHKFRISLKRQVDVEMVTTVLAGDRECRFNIIVS